MKTKQNVQEMLYKEIYPVRLRLELKNEWCGDDEKRVLTKYVDANENGTFVRDILIPSDMPLHNLHYAIQRLFGWQNSHLHCFKLEESDFERLTYSRVKEWMELVGVLFLGTPNDQDDAFWDDDYFDGSFKVWLRKKYIGPYSYGGYVEEYEVAKESVQQLVDRFPVIEVKESFHEYYERTKGIEKAEKEPMRILKKAPIMELTLQELNDTIMFDNSFDTLLERLEVISVLASSDETLVDAELLGTRMVSPIYECNSGITEEVEEPEVLPVTHKIRYNYDYGDNWEVEITRSNDNSDLLNAGIITKDVLREAEKIVIDKHKPVCISKKGAFVLDDVGGMSGYADFITTIYEGDDKEERKRYREWAESLGWNNRKVALERML